MALAKVEGDPDSLRYIQGCWVRLQFGSPETISVGIMTNSADTPSAVIELTPKKLLELELPQVSFPQLLSNPRYYYNKDHYGSYYMATYLEMLEKLIEAKCILESSYSNRHGESKGVVGTIHVDLTLGKSKGKTHFDYMPNHHGSYKLIAGHPFHKI